MVFQCNVAILSACGAQALPSGDLEALLQQHPEMMGRAPSFGMGKLESMELPDAVAAVVRPTLALM